MPAVSARSVIVVCLGFLSCLCLLLISVEARTDAEGALTDLRALLEFKRSITDDPLSILKNWDDIDDAAASNACNWTGISCSTKHQGRVVQISLQNFTLRGSISPHVANVSFLQVLDISNNSFSGKIPPSLARMPRLKVLNLCGNELNGAIPHDIGNLSSLQRLFLCENSLNGEIPGSLAKLRNLSVLNLYQNRLAGKLPSFLGRFSKLELLELSENNFHGVIPADLGNLSSLQSLDLEFNHLSGSIPCSVSSLPRLAYLALGENSLSGSLPRCLGNLTALTELTLLYNNFQGYLPEWVGKFQKLDSLSIAYNGFTGTIPLSWANMTQLTFLELSHNGLSGAAPSWFGKAYSQLGRLNLAENHFTSGVRIRSQPIPLLESLSNCSQLTGLGLFDNMLTGTLPHNIGNFWPNLQYLSVSINFISGKIPPSIGNLSSLILLDLSNNIFSGTIPVQIADLKSVQSLGIYSNQFHGKIPAEISLLNNTLNYLYLAENTLSGSIPDSIGKLVNLRDLDLSQNMLSGKIPSQIGGCSVLEYFDLSENNLSGVIPPEVAGLKTIIFHFVLSRNRLNGEVPREIAGLQRAQYIDLSSNQLLGNIAFSLDSWLDARDINLSFNFFSGNLSRSVGKKLTQLESIDLSHNNFTGSVPASLFNLSHLHFLNFSYNKFDQKVPCLQASSKHLRLSRWSFIGNPNLCGRCFGLRACNTSAEHHSSHSRKNSILKIVLGILGGLVLLVVTGVLLIFRKVKESRTEIPRIGEHFLKISMEELYRATENFSAPNLIGEGIHGKVYRGVLSSGTAVAIKCYSCKSQNGTPTGFVRECRTLARARHRNILKIITVVWSDELKAVVMPFMSNGSLHSLLHCRQDGQLAPVDLPTRLRLLREIAMGLTYLHHDCNIQIIHCDIKPENILLDDDMTVKLSDFAIAHLIGDSRGSITSSSLAVKGSVGYIAPEYGLGEQISVKGDVYSFGVVTLELITRMKPTNEMFSADLTLSQWISMAMEGKSGEAKRQMLKEIIKTGDDGGGIELNKDEEMSGVERILTVGLRCTSRDARLRPDMKEVESALQSISIGDMTNQRTPPGNLEEVIQVMEGQRPFYPRTTEDSSSFSG